MNSLTFGLRNILADGREFAGVYGNYIRTKGKDGIYRLYKEIDGELRFMGAAKTSVQRNNSNIVRTREKFRPINNNQHSNVYVERTYSPNGKKIGAECQENLYEVSNDLTVRDNDISNIVNLDKTQGVYNIGFKSVYKDCTGQQLPYGYKTTEGYKIAGTESKGLSASNLQENHLTYDELSRYNNLL